ncbi:hypothetical protein TNCT_88331 [Trichonephila clavata]|uniref:Uncharacterized protein n=1 Tax=Trichonephila clavata TaxID=2740835 RepID=A0A8X6FMI1_TRICU|nr:hypothetical protein TNCT_88331 [Trichonephila clavata]
MIKFIDTELHEQTVGGATLPEERMHTLYRLQGNRKVTDSWLAYHEFEPITTEDPPCRGTMHVKSVKS